MKNAALLIAPVMGLLFWGLAFGKPGHVGKQEGFYASSRQKDGSRSYVRLYQAGTAITVTSTGNPKQVAKWFNKSHPFVSKGRYYVEGQAIQFSASSTDGTIDYKGTISNEHLRLNICSHINKHKDFQEYTLVPK